MSVAATLGIDPGKQKTGLAVVDETGQILWRAIVVSTELEQSVADVLEQFDIGGIVLGDSTASRSTEQQVRSLLDRKTLDIPLQVVDEGGSTLEARTLYWRANPRSGWRKWVPLSLQNPPGPIDDFAAAVIALRGLKAAQKIAVDV